MTSKNNRTPLPYYAKLCDFLYSMTLEFDGWPWKTIGHSCILHQALCIMSKPSVKQTGIIIRKRLNWVLTSVTLTFCMDLTLVIGNHSWKFHDDTTTGTLTKRCDRQTDERTHRRMHWTIHRATWSQLKTQKNLNRHIFFLIQIVPKSSP